MQHVRRINVCAAAGIAKFSPFTFLFIIFASCRFPVTFCRLPAEAFRQKHTICLRRTSRQKGVLNMASVDNNADICQLPDGTGAFTDWLASAVGAQSHTDSLTYNIPAADVVRGPHSVAARLLLHGTGEVPSSVFLKRVVPRELPARKAPKWVRDTQSYRTVLLKEDSTFEIILQKNSS